MGVARYPSKGRVYNQAKANSLSPTDWKLTNNLKKLIFSRRELEK